MNLQACLRKICVIKLKIHNYIFACLIQRAAALKCLLFISKNKWYFISRFSIGK